MDIKIKKTEADVEKAVPSLHMRLMVIKSIKIMIRQIKQAYS
jgi:hypothetical protein